MKLEVGTDIIEIARIRDAIERHKERFLDRLFTKEEQRYCESKAEPALHYAARFSAKEALYKALNDGQGAIPLIEFEVAHDGRGAPVVRLGLEAKKRFGGQEISLSISHCREYATAVVICKKE